MAELSCSRGLGSHLSTGTFVTRRPRSWSPAPRRIRPGKIWSPKPSLWPSPHPIQVLRVDLISAEPYMPHVLMEKGDMTLGEFDQHLKGRTDFIKGTKKDSSAERKVSPRRQG
ncbi:hypothetical protein GHT09_002103 [Marmota monax]|uniref:Uncharacterized protein n=1 Tax=Marmota monax TaxID=9995 RepID=A0A834PWJ0_MARMO|nr:hypothetical protein GHT09_002103 [Marmota monax]